jgi:hypothetical protein
MTRRGRPAFNLFAIILPLFDVATRVPVARYSRGNFDPVDDSGGVEATANEAHYYADPSRLMANKRLPVFTVSEKIASCHFWPRPSWVSNRIDLGFL